MPVCLLLAAGAAAMAGLLGFRVGYRRGAAQADPPTSRRALRALRGLQRRPRDHEPPALYH